jgi:hypothetical protein
MRSRLIQRTVSRQIYRQRNLIERYFNNSSTSGVSPPASTNSRATSSPPSPWPRHGYGSGLMSPRPSRPAAAQRAAMAFTKRHLLLSGRTVPNRSNVQRQIKKPAQS